MYGIGDDVGDVLVDEGVHGLSPAPLDSDEPGCSQHPQVLGHKRLAHPEPVDQLMHEPRLLGQLSDDRQPGRGRQHPQQVPGRLERLRLR